jgi:hypothetical protein
MTIAIAWVRRILDCEELVFASDSRLSGDGRIFDAAPKILTLPRTDCAIAFAGKTQDAFPMMLQLSLAISAYSPSRRRSMDVAQVKTHALKVFNAMAGLISSDVRVKGNPPDEAPGAEFLFGGYSWVAKRFKLWRIYYSITSNSFVAEKASLAFYSEGIKKVVIRPLGKPRHPGVLGRIAIAGDQADTARNLICEALTADYVSGRIAQKNKIDMQPFEVIVRMLRNPCKSETIGGAPQLAKVYQYMQAVSFPIYWPTRESGMRCLQGRPCIGYEQLDTKLVDPDDLAWIPERAYREKPD